MKCQGITTIKENGVFRTCHNDALRFTRFCWLPSHKAQGGTGCVTDQLSEVRDYGPPMDMDMPTDPAARKAYLRDKIRNNRPEENS